MTAVPTLLQLPSHYAKDHQLFTTRTQALVGGTTFGFWCTFHASGLYKLCTEIFVFTLYFCWVFPTLYGLGAAPKLFWAPP